MRNALVCLAALAGCAAPSAGHVSVESDLPEAEVRRLISVLEQAVDSYRTLYAGVWDLSADPPVVKVRLIGDPEEFKRIVTQAQGMESGPGTQGRYLHGNRTLYVNAGRNDELTPAALSTAVHEFNHALDHLWAGQERPKGCPFWSFEGRSDYLGYTVVQGRLVPGAAAFSRDTPEVLEKTLAYPISLGELVDLRGKGFYNPTHVNSHSVLSWAFVHFLFHGDGGSHAEGFRKYLSGLPGRFQRTHVEAALGDLDDLDAPFRDYLRDTLMPAVRNAAAP
jgi:hypothetical protein